MKSCDHSTLPVFLSNANICFCVPMVNRRSPTMSGVECGPAPKLKSSRRDGYLCSHSVLPVAASIAITVSSASHGPCLARPLPARYMVNSRPSSTRIAEWPVPSGRDQITGGPVSGHFSASPVVLTMKLRFGPPHCSHEFDAVGGFDLFDCAVS